MQIASSSRFRNLVVIAAVGASLLQAQASLLFLFFGAYYSTIALAFCIVSGFLWVPALACRKYPRGGLLVYTLFLGVAFALYPFLYQHPHVAWILWGEAARFLQFALIGGALLALNLVLAKKCSSNANL
jgi:hypothetical protein